MKIAIDIRCLMSKEKTGVAEYCLNLLKNLFKNDQKNEYLLFYNSSQSVEKNLPKFDYPNVKLCGFKIPNKLLNFSFRFFNYPKVDKMLGGVDLFFMPNLNFIALSKDVKKIITAHDLSFEIYPQFYSLERRLWHWFVQPKKLFKNFDKIIAVSENTKKDLVEIYKIAEEKIKTDYPIINRRNEALPRSVFSSKIEVKRTRQCLVPTNQKFILYFGTLEPRKNIETLILAYNNILKKNKEFEYNLVIAGGKGWLFRNIFELIKKLNLQNRVEILGYVDSGQKWELYQNTSLFIYPSIYEGFGFPPLEALNSGCPVIVSNSSSLPEVIGNASLMVDPYNIAELELAIKKILADENIRNYLIKQSGNQAKNIFVNKSIERFLEIFEK